MFDILWMDNDAQFPLMKKQLNIIEGLLAGDFPETRIKLYLVNTPEMAESILKNLSKINLLIMNTIINCELSVDYTLENTNHGVSTGIRFIIRNIQKLKDANTPVLIYLELRNSPSIA